MDRYCARRVIQKRAIIYDIHRMKKENDKTKVMIGCEPTGITGMRLPST